MLKLVLAEPSPLALDLAELELAVNRWRSVEGQINIKLVDDATIRQLNRNYAGHDYATDVLSFPYPDAQGAELGDIAISWETATRQAESAGHSQDNEIKLLVLHGILHILGYDHSTQTQKHTMQAAQEDLAAQVGLKNRNTFEDNKKL